MSASTPPPPDPDTVPWRMRTFASLENANYRRFFAGQAISMTGTWMQSVALSWLVLQLTHSATWLGLAIALQFIPVLLLGPYGGVVVDRVDKRRLIIATQTAAAVQALALGLLAATGTATLGWVLVLSVTLGLINVLDNPARQAFVREMVSAGQVRNAVSLNSVLVNVARAVGPAVAGVLIASTGVGVCFFINAASFIAAILAYATMDVSRLTPTAPVARAPGQLREGLRYVGRTPDLLVPLVMMALVGTLTYEFQVSLPAFATASLGGDARTFGLITACMGVGAVAGGLFSAGQSATGIGPMATAAAAFGGTDRLAAIAPNEAFAAVALVAVGACSIWFLATGNATLQMSSSPEMRGRVMALWTVAFLGSTPIGGPIIGWVAENASPRWALALGAAAALAAAAMGVLARARVR
jgi:MFS family permease